MAAYIITDQLTDNGSATRDTDDGASLTDVIGSWFVLDAELDDMATTVRSVLEDLESSLICNEYVGALTAALGIKVSPA